MKYKIVFKYSGDNVEKNRDFNINLTNREEIVFDSKVEFDDYLDILNKADYLNIEGEKYHISETSVSPSLKEMIYTIEVKCEEKYDSKTIDETERIKGMYEAFKSASNEYYNK